jgi:hypothetical protein
VTRDPQILQALSVGVVAAAMIVLGRSKKMLPQRRPERCAACGRLREPGRRCAHCR